MFYCFQYNYNYKCFQTVKELNIIDYLKIKINLAEVCL